MKLSLAEWLPTVNYNPDEDGIAETPSRILWVGNIGPDVSEEELEQEFGQFGKIESLRILHNRFCAFVNFEVEESAREAKKNLHGTIIGSQYIVIHYRKVQVNTGLHIFLITLARSSETCYSRNARC